MGLWLISLLASTVAGAGLAADSAKDGSSEPLARWTLSTADTTLTVGAGADHKLYLYELRGPTGWNWTAAPSPFPLVSRLDLAGVPCQPNWRYGGGTVDRSEGTRVVITFTNAHPAMEISSVWHARSGPGPVRHAMFIRNNAGQPVTIYHQESVRVKVAGPGNTLPSVWYFNDDGSIPDQTGVYHEPLSPGYQKTLRISEEQDFIPFAAVDAGNTSGVYAGWEWSIGRVGLSHASDGTLLKAGNRDDFRTDLQAGETFEVPPGFLGAYAGDMDDCGNSLRKYLFNYSMPAMLKRDPGFPKVEWNAFAPTGKKQGSWDPTEKKYYPFIDDIAPLGFEEVVIDIGWWSGYGDPGHIVTDPEDWPSGMAAAAKYAHDRGIRFGLYDNETEDLTSASGKEERVRDITYLIKELKADFYRSDSTAGPVLKGAHGPGQRAHYPEDAEYWAAKGFYEVIDTMYATIPTFLWEACSGGGRIKDFGVSRRAARIQNQDRYYPLDARQSFYDTSHIMHPMQIAALDGSWAEWQATGSVYEFRSCSMGAAYWHPDAPNGGNGGPVWTAAHKALIKEAVNTYKTWIRPLIRTANLYHIFPRPDDKVWDGIEYFDPRAKRGAVYVFRPNSPDQAQTVRFKGLDARASYWLWSEDGATAALQRPGEALMQSGLTLRLPASYSSDIIFIQDASLGKPDGLQAPETFGLQPTRFTPGLFGVSVELSWQASPHARRYRVMVGDTPELRRVLASEVCLFPAISIANLPPARALYWKVEAISPGGTRGNEGEAQPLTTPESLAQGVTFASDMPWIKATAGAGNPVRRDVNLHERAITMGGKRCEKGLWTHSFNDPTPADTVFDIAGKPFATFQAAAGLEDLGAGGSVRFQVLVDGELKAQSPILRGGAICPLRVEVTGAKQITLRVLNGGDGYSSDHAVWGFARFIRAGETDPVPPWNP